MSTSTSNYNNATYSICNTALIFESFGDPHPITDIVCGDKSQAWSFYREVPASISESRKYPDGPALSSSNTIKLFDMANDLLSRFYRASQIRQRLIWIQGMDRRCRCWAIGRHCIDSGRCLLLDAPQEEQEEQPPADRWNSYGSTPGCSAIHRCQTSTDHKCILWPSPSGSRHFLQPANIQPRLCAANLPSLAVSAAIYRTHFSTASIRTKRICSARREDWVYWAAVPAGPSTTHPASQRRGTWRGQQPGRWRFYRRTPFGNETDVVAARIYLCNYTHRNALRVIPVLRDNLACAFRQGILASPII